jgi:hypothetical protein
MKQSNIDYRDTYHFNALSKRDENNSPSIAHDPDINSTIKENPYKSNVEIEKDEIVLRPDLSALHKAGGKKHTSGGTNVYLPEDSFIFSDDKNLAFKKNDFKTFELKGDGKKKKLSTPAKVLQSNIDLKHYNAMMTILQDPTKDKVAKDTAALMLEKYLGIVGNIAYIQEDKKNFPQGVPDVSMGTAPVYDADLKTEIEENKQYMKYGGTIDNPYKMQSGGFLPVSGDNTNSGRIPSLRRVDRYIGKRPPYPNEWKNYYDNTEKKQYTAPDWINPESFYGTPGVIDYMKTLNSMNGIDNDLNKPDDAWWGYRHQAALEKFYPNGRPNPSGRDYGLIDKTGPILKYPPFNFPEDKPQPPSEDQIDTIEPNEVKGNAQNGIPVNWEFTPWQKLNHLYNAGKWAGVSREMPLRSRYRATYAEPSLLNPEQTIADTKAVANKQIDSMDYYSPILSQAQKASAYGQYLDKIPEIRSQYDNQNSQIENQFRQYNNQLKNDETTKNIGLDQNYWRESAVGRQNFKNMRGFLGDQYMNNINQDVEDNQSLAYNILALGPKPAYGYDWKTGNFLRNDKNILDVQDDSRQDILQNYMGQIDFKNLTAKEKIDYLNVLTKRDALRYIRPGYKKGGTYKKNPYK